MYIVAVAVLMVAIPVLKMNPIVVTAIFLIIVAWATARIKEEAKEDKIIKQIDDIVGCICTVIYFIVSFITMAWYITWVIFIIDGLIVQIIKLIFMLKEDKTDEE